MSVYYQKIRQIQKEHGLSVTLQQIIHRVIKRSRLFYDFNIKKQFYMKNSRLSDPDLLDDVVDFMKKGLFRNPEQVRADLKTIPEAEQEAIIKEADEILLHKHKLYDNINLSMNGKFSWLKDPLTGYQWPSCISSKAVAFNKPVGTDIKNIWEISRFQFLRPISLAYALTQKKRYFIYIQWVLQSWCEENRFPEGPNWSRAMEASIRLMNASLYLPLVDCSLNCNKEDWERLLVFYIEHLVFIEKNLEVSPAHSNNHYLANLVGLLINGIIFTRTSWGKKTTAFAEHAFYKEILKQFREDGINYEGSLSYHRLSCEIIFVGLLLLKKMNRQITDQVGQRLERIADCTNYMAGVSETTPIIGDNDSGVFLSFFTGQGQSGLGYITLLHDHILSENLITDSAKDFFVNIHFEPTVFYQKKLLPVSDERANSNKTRSFDGLIVASGHQAGFYFNTLANGLSGSGGHTHNDKLSFYPYFSNYPVFIDKGSFSYSGYPLKRYEDQQSKIHNGPVINQWEQNTLFEKEMFRIGGESVCASTITESEDSITVTGWHDGYQRFSPGYRMYRSICWDYYNTTMTINDWVETPVEKQVNFSWCFLIHPLWQTVLEENILILNHKSIHIEINIPSEIHPRLANGNYSPGYQFEKPCLMLEMDGLFRPDYRIKFVINY